MTKPTTRPSRANDAAAYLSALIGRPWSRDGLHCWRLVCDVERELFARALPAVLEVAPLGRTGLRQRADLFADHQERANWREVVGPVHGAVVLMNRVCAPDDLIHAGVYLALDGGGVLHCDEPHGVVFDSLRELTMLRHWLPRFFIPRD